MTSEPIIIDRYTDIREAFYNPDLSRGLDPTSYEEGNPRDGVLSTLHGDEHKERRRLENPLFRRSALVEYERGLFPAIVDEICAENAVGDVDLLELSGTLAVVLAAKRAGIDHDGSQQQLLELWSAGVTLAQAAALADVVTDKETVRRDVFRTLDELRDRYVLPSMQHREALLHAGEDLPHDLLSVALRSRRAGELALDDDLLTREVGLYLHGGSHTSAQTTCNAFHILLGYEDGPERGDLLKEAGSSALVAQQIVHETLRLRPMTPRVKRRAIRPTEVGGHRVDVGQTVVLDVRAANRDPALYGDDPDAFDIQRRVSDKAQLWGLSFGAGAHICIGRSVAGGFPLHGAEEDEDTTEAHLYGLVAHMVRAIAARHVSRHPDADPELDTRTSRGSRWSRFPVRFPDS
jgi:cytochrome P450